MPPETATPPAATPPAAASAATPPATPPAATPPAIPPAGDKKPDAAKPAEPSKPPEGTTAAPVVPEKYDLQLPDGSPIGPDALEAFSSQAKNEKLTQEQAQARLERESALLASYQDAQAAELEKLSQGEWMETIKTDKEIGGENLNKNVEVAKRVVQKFGSPALMENLNRTRLGNYPEFVRMMVRIGKAMSEDQLIVPGAQVPAKERPLEDIFYGETTPQPTT